MNELLDSDLYAVLGVAPDADAAAITRAYRRLARDTHPDTHPGDEGAEERFKEVAAAYAVLGDADKRAEYDEFRAMVGNRRSGGHRQGSTANPFDGGFWQSGDADLGDLFGGLFADAARRQGPRRGPNVMGTVTIDLLDVVKGTTVEVTLPDGTRVPVAIEAGIDDGTVLRLPGRGLAGMDGGPAGDLIVEVSVRDRAPFTRDGADLVVDVPVGFATAALGGKVAVPTLGGAPVTVRVPAGSADGRRLRIPGRGLPGHGRRGDLHARLRIHVPAAVDDATRAALESIRDRLEP